MTPLFVTTKKVSSLTKFVTINGHIHKFLSLGGHVYSGQWDGMLLPLGDSIVLVVRSVDMIEPVGLIALDHRCVNLLG